MMTGTITLDRILSLPETDIESLQEGKTIAALPIAQVQKGWSFLLYPHSTHETLNDVSINSWGTCESFKMIHDVEQLDILAALTLWNKFDLEKLMEVRGHLSLAVLKIYRLPNPVVVSERFISDIKFGKFVGISNLEIENKFIKSSESLPVLSSTIFNNRYKQITQFQVPEHPNLEGLQSTIAHYAQTHSEAKVLDEDLKAFLGWADPQEFAKITPPWVKEITKSGNSSDGNLFEKCVRQGFITLGFTNTLKNIKASLDPDATGGAGGIDIYCEKPYSIVGECKASKHESVPNSVSAQLIHLGNTHLGKATFDTSIKIIFAAGKLTDHAEKAAIENHINVMRPETLQRLVELKTAHPGAIDLLELKPCLESAPFGTDADTKVNDFIAKIWQKIEIRSQVIQAVKALKQDGDDLVNASDVRNRFNAFASSEDKFSKPEDTHNLLIELSSPLTGYLGRTKGDNWKADRFYFLRDLIV
jgi:hypothetical protein